LLLPFLLRRARPGITVGDPAITIAFYVSVTGLALGVASLFGIRKHGWSAILWKAVIGILASAFCSVYAVLGIVSRVANQ